MKKIKVNDEEIVYIVEQQKSVLTGYKPLITTEHLKY